MKTYLYDGSFPGLLTAIFYAYSNRAPTQVVMQDHYHYNLLDETVEVTTEEAKFERVYASLLNKLSRDTLKIVYYLYLSEDPSHGTLILDYLRLCYRYGLDINLAKNNETIIAVDALYRKVSLEVHRLYGFVRFKEIGPLTFYSSIEPDYQVLSLIANHFITRFSDQNFIIHDLRRHMALVYNQQDYYLQEIPQTFYTQISGQLKNDGFEDLFKTFYYHTAIMERKNQRQQLRYMPRRYWKHLVELQ
ncbi:MAG: TIGR03915 family putative DNA repair protein [Cellulosilyticaceae bacterium]